MSGPLPPDDAPPRAPAPPDNPELAAALSRTQSGDDPTTVELVEDLLLRSTLIAPVSPAAQREGSEVVLAPAARDAGLDLVAALRPTGDTALLAFTGTGTLTRWSREQSFVAATAVTLCGVVLERDLDAVWLDPAGPASVTISASQLQAIAAGRRPSEDQDSASSPQPPAPLDPLDDPLEQTLTAVLSAALEHRGEVEAAQLMEGEPVLGRRQLVIGLRLSDAADGNSFGPIAKVRPDRQGLPRGA